MSLEKNENLVEKTLLQMKSIEEAISENAKGILASTMKEEISELVKESLFGTKTKVHDGQFGHRPRRQCEAIG